MPNALVAVGLTVHTLSSVYGEQNGQMIGDEEWLRLAGAKGWVVLMKDEAIRRRRHELDALARAGVRAFCLTNGNLTGEEMADRFVTNRHRISAACNKPAPFIKAVHKQSLRLIWSATRK